MSTFKVIAVTNRALCAGDFLMQVRKVAKAHPYRIILREKDLPEADYTALAKQVLRICEEEGAICTLHAFPEAAKALRCPRIHLPLHKLQQYQKELSCFSEIGASVHSVQEAKLAQAAGATYLTAGHVFETDCKRGIAPRGLDFLQQVCQSVTIPVYAIGGVGLCNLEKIKTTNASGACMMSGFMRAKDAAELLVQQS